MIAHAPGRSRDREWSFCRVNLPDQGFRNRTYWFDPARHMWVKFVEVFHGERHTAGFSFTYDSNLTAVLASFTP